MEDVGSRLKEVRKAAALSQRELAKRAGVTNSTISMIEKNNVSPSISSLKKVLAGIPMSLIEFFDNGEEEQVDRPVVYRGDDVQVITTESGIEWQVFGKNFPNRQMNLMLEIYPPGSDTGIEGFVHEGEETGFVISGQIELTVDDQVYTLQPGEGYYFESHRPHRFRNPFAEPCHLASALTPPNL
ncbi:cupin domain-containing protein [Reinekea sp. G2M2-21]|uniref:cupin domain-containing protein n=1 Tax=Reinekea sp. G2M2-21 TaxID=2788942 RepID=UPI0018AC15E4|nr:cupin domain-containing protein [Reinekea sp. G2M2-21]MDX1341163.1 cupin domain-containing protein [Reinekea sp.]MDX1475571.1 cupin domain-containing protein [Reinekea sp.]